MTAWTNGRTSRGPRRAIGGSAASGRAATGVAACVIALAAAGAAGAAAGAATAMTPAIPAGGEEVRADVPVVRGAADAPRDGVRALAPQPVRGLLVARPFRLQTPFRHAWRAERPAVEAGWLLVLEVDPALVRPRQTAMPVLYAGDQTAARVNVGHDSGRLVVIVPDAPGEDGRPATPLAELPIWFGDADLPERVDAADVAAARRAAAAAGVRPRTEAERSAAIERGRVGASLDEAGVAVHADRLELMLAAMDLVETWAPDEAGLAEDWRLAAEAARAVQAEKGPAEAGGDGSSG